MSWTELADFLRKAELPVYRDPDSNLLDSTDSHISVTWRDGGEEFTNNYNGTYAHDLLELLKDIAQETSAAMLESDSGKEHSLQKTEQETK